MPTSGTGRATYLSFVGLGKEVTRGTAVAATAFLPVKTITPSDKYNYVPDTGMRGSYVTAYDELATQAWSEFSFSGDVFVDTVGNLLLGELGDLTTTAGTPNSHAFALLNTGPGQPASFTITDYNGFNARQFAGSQFSKIEFKYNANGLLEYDAMAKGFHSVVGSTPSKSYTSEPPKQVWTGVTTIGGSATSILQEGTLTLERPVDPILTVNGTQDPYAMWAGPITVTGHAVYVYVDDTELTRYTGQASTTLNINFTRGSGAALRSIAFDMQKVIYKKADITRGKNYVELDVDFEAVANTSNVGTSGGFCPIGVTLQNAASGY